MKDAIKNKIKTFSIFILINITAFFLLLIIRELVYYVLASGLRPLLILSPLFIVFPAILCTLAYTHIKNKIIRYIIIAVFYIIFYKFFYYLIQLDFNVMSRA